MSEPEKTVDLKEVKDLTRKEMFARSRQLQAKGLHGRAYELRQEWYMHNWDSDHHET